MSAERDMRMLHPASLLLRLGPHARNLLVPGLIVLVVTGGSGIEIWLMVLFLPSMIFEFLQYAIYRYRLDRVELVVVTGLLSRNTRHVPLRRIQTVDVQRGVLHRLLGVAEVRLETAAGAKPEAVLRVVTMDEARRLSAAATRAPTPSEVALNSTDSADADALRTGRATNLEEAAGEGRTILALAAADLARLGILTFRGAALFAVLFGLAWQFDLFDQVDVSSWIENARAVSALGTEMIIGVGGLLALAILLIASVAWAVLRFHGFCLTQRGDDFHIAAGLLTQRSATIPRRRISLVAVHQSPAMRLLGCVKIRVETAGGAGWNEREGEDRSFAQRWFIPIMPRNRTPEILAIVRPGFDFEALRWRPISSRAPRRVVKKALLLALILTLAVTLVAPPWGALSALLFSPLFILLARKRARRAACATAPGLVAQRAGVLFQSITIAFEERIHTVRLASSPFDRRWRMASVSVDTAGAGAAGSRVDVSMLDAESAEALAYELSMRIAAASPRYC